MAKGPMGEVLQRLRTAAVGDGAGLTDGQLLESFLARRDEAAFAALVRRHGPLVWGVCRRTLGNFHDAEDAFQATFLVLLRKAASIGSRELLANWLYGVAYRVALKARSAGARRRVRERQVAAMPEPEAPRTGRPHDVQPLLDRELSLLPDRYRAPIVLCDLQGKSRKEAAAQLGCPEGTVAGQLARARRMLAKRLARHGLAVSGTALAAYLSQPTASAAVPASVTAATLRAANLLAAGRAAAEGAVSAKVAALADATLRSMVLAKVKAGMAVVLAASLVTTGVTLGVRSATPQGEQATLAVARPGTADALADSAWAPVSPASAPADESSRPGRGDNPPRPAGRLDDELPPPPDDAAGGPPAGRRLGLFPAPGAFPPARDETELRNEVNLLFPPPGAGRFDDPGDRPPPPRRGRHGPPPDDGPGRDFRPPFGGRPDGPPPRDGRRGAPPFGGWRGGPSGRDGWHGGPPPPADGRRDHRPRPDGGRDAAPDGGRDCQPPPEIRADQPKDGRRL